MRLLLDKGADPNIATFAGTTPLMAAAGVNWVGGQTYSESKQFLEAVELCLEKGADVNAVNSMGITAVIGAANRGSDDILELLVKKGAALDVKDKQGRTPLVWAEGVFLATNPPEKKPSTMALIQRLTSPMKNAARMPDRFRDGLLCASAQDRALLDRYCVGCHNEKTAPAVLRSTNWISRIPATTRRRGKKWFEKFAPE